MLCRRSLTSGQESLGTPLDSCLFEPQSRSGRYGEGNFTPKERARRTPLDKGLSRSQSWSGRCGEGSCTPKDRACTVEPLGIRGWADHRADLDGVEQKLCYEEFCLAGYNTLCTACCLPHAVFLLGLLLRCRQLVLWNDLNLHWTTQWYIQEDRISWRTALSSGLWCHIHMLYLCTREYANIVHWNSPSAYPVL